MAASAKYETLKVVELRKLLSDRGLPGSGKKVDLVAALKASDAENTKPVDTSAPTDAVPEKDQALNSQTEEEKRVLRAKRFGLPADEEARRAMRATRFTEPEDGNEAARRTARAQRFGLVDQTELMKRRAERFGMPV